jgi:hypothetical protein
VQVLNLVREVEVVPDSARDSSSFNIKAKDGLRIRKAVRGLGVLYFYWSGGVWSPRPQWNKSLLISRSVPVDIPDSSKSNEPSVRFEFREKMACSGAVSPELGGFLVAPTIKLDVAEGKDIAAMLISPRPGPASVMLGKSALSIPSEGSGVKVELSSGDELRCEGTLSGNWLSAQLLVTRNSNPPITGLELAEVIGELKQPGRLSATWKPITRSFEELLFVFRPLDVNLEELDELVEHVGAKSESFDEAGAAPFVIGDGPEGSYVLKLVVKRHLRGDVSDQTSIMVS